MLLTFNYVLVALTSKRKDNTTQLFFVYRTLALVSFFSFLFIPCVVYNKPSLGKMYELSIVLFIGEHRYSVFSSLALRLEFIHFNIFHFLNLFVHIFIFSNRKSHFHHLIKGF